MAHECNGLPLLVKGFDQIGSILNPWPGPIKGHVHLGIENSIVIRSLYRTQFHGMRQLLSRRLVLGKTVGKFRLSIGEAHFWGRSEAALLFGSQCDLGAGIRHFIIG